MILPDLLVRHSTVPVRLGSVKPRRAIAKRGYYPCIKEMVSMLNRNKKSHRNGDYGRSCDGRRLHSALGYQPPEEFEQQLKSTKLPRTR